MLLIRPLFVDVGKAYVIETDGVEIEVNCPSALYPRVSVYPAAVITAIEPSHCM